MGDRFYNSVSALLHFEGADASTTFTDSSGTPHTFTAVGNAQIDTAQFKYGAAAGLFDGTGDYLTGDGDTAFAFGTGDFTIEGWVRPASFAANRMIFDCRPNATNGFYPALFLNVANAVFHINGGNVIDGAHGMVANTWYHIAVSRVSSVTRLFIGGVQVGGSYADTNNYLCGASRPAIGSGGFTLGGDVWNGHLDDLRVTKGVGRYSAAFTPPTEAFSDEVEIALAQIDASLPILTTAIYSGPQIDVTMPALAVEIFTGPQIDVSLPALTFAGQFGSVMDLDLPALTAYLVAHDATGENAIDITLPSLTFDAWGGAQIVGTLPALTFEAELTGTSLASLDATLPMLEAELTGTASATAQINATLPMATFVGYGGAVLDVTLGAVTAEIEATAGAVGSIVATLPMFDLELEVTRDATATLDLILPAIQSGPSASIWAVLPGVQFVAVGTATVAVTYEAYSLNLNHKGQKNPVDELTRYTNFPFTKIVRYRNSYFGVAADGLYLLEGTTDYASPTPTAIPWAFKTAMTDFGSPARKALVATYFSGRLGAAMTVTMYEGDDTPIPYTYTTSLDADARNYRQKFGLGSSARYYAVGASGSNELSLDELAFDLAPLSRRL